MRLRQDAARHAVAGRSFLMVTVTVCSPRSDLTQVWDDLVARASPNVFMNPAILRAAQNTMFALVHILCAWEGGGETQKLVGLWGLQERQIFPLWPTFLEALPFEYAFLSSPVIDPAYSNEVMAAFFSAIRTSRQLPNVVSLKQLDGEAASYKSLQTVIADGGHRVLQLSESLRPVASPDTGVKKSGSTRKKLRQDWNRLAALGAVDVVNARGAETARQDFESFLALEMQSWKGAEGTALLCSERDARFVREMFAALAAENNASVAILRLDGRAIAAQVLLYCGKTAYTWKTAFDAEFAKFSPGALLIDKVTEELFSTGGIESIDSCSAEGSFMANLWTGRRAMVDILVDVGPQWSASFAMEAGRQIGRERLRHLRDRVRGLSLRQPGRKPKLAAPQ